jgi:hypothetical protein
MGSLGTLWASSSGVRRLNAEYDAVSTVPFRKCA